MKNVPVDDNTVLDIYKDMQVTITRNQCKTLSVVNGHYRLIKHIRKESIIIHLHSSKTVFVYKMEHEENYEQYFPLLPFYVCTICKAQGQNLTPVTICLNCTIKSPVTVYTAISRTPCHDSIPLLQVISREKVCPITFVNKLENISLCHVIYILCALFGVNNLTMNHK